MSASRAPQGGDLTSFTNRTFAAVLFDLDGTLIDSTPAVIRSWTSWALERGLPIPDLAANHGRPAIDLVAQMVPPEQLIAALVDFQQIELADVVDIVALPGAAELLAAAGERAAVVTSGTRPLALARLAAAGLAAPAVTITFDDVRQGKPHPEPFLVAAGRLGVDPIDCVVVEDAPAGIAAGQAAGCVTLAVRGTHTATQLARADAIVDRLTAVIITDTADGLRITARP